MANAKICDRCERVYPRNRFETEFDEDRGGTVKGVCVMFKESSDSPNRKNFYMDLCDDCARSLVEFLKDPRIGPWII